MRCNPGTNLQINPVYSMGLRSHWVRILPVVGLLVGCRGSPSTELPVTSAMRDSSVPIAPDPSGAQSVGIGAASAVIVASAAAAAAAASRKRSGPTITNQQKQACVTAFDMALSGQGSSERDCPSDVRDQLVRDLSLTRDQIQRQYVAYCKRRLDSSLAARAPAAADQPLPSSARAAPSAGAASSAGANGASSSRNITAQQRQLMLEVFRAHASSWGEKLPSATPVNPTAHSRPLMALIEATGLKRAKLVSHYATYLQSQQSVRLSTSLAERRAEIDERLVLQEVLEDALARAENHAICQLSLRAQQCVGKLREGACAADLRALLEQQIELVAEHTVCVMSETRAAENSLGFAMLASNAAWVQAVPDLWMTVLGHDGYEAEKRAVVFARQVMAESLYDALRSALHATRNQMRHFPSRSEVNVGDRLAPVLYYVAGWLLNCIRRDRVSVEGAWQIWLRTNCLDGVHTARKHGLPHALVTKRSMGGLLYASWRFFHFVWYVEQCYVSSLTMEALLVHGRTTLLKVHSRLLADKEVLHMFEKTFTPEYTQSARELLEVAGQSSDAITETLDKQNSALLGELLRMYMRMRGRDAVAKLTAQARLASHDVNSLRAKLAAGAAAAVDKQKPVPAAKADLAGITGAARDEFPIDDELRQAMLDCVDAASAAAILSAGDSAWAVSERTEDPESTCELMALIEADEDS